MVDLKDLNYVRVMRSSNASATLGTCFRATLSTLDKAGIDGYDVEARLLCEWAIGRAKIDFMTRPNDPVASEQVAILEQVLEKRLAGMPVHRIMGYREFYGMRLELSSETLEPRPDTETLVDQVIDIIKESGKLQAPLRILDLGTGTGAIALALLSKVPNAEAIAVDISRQAIETASKNAEFLGLSSRFKAVQSDWFGNIEGKFDIIVSNPPYIRTQIIAELAVEVREHDPLVALDGGPDGLAPYRIIASKGEAHLSKSGVVCVEIGYDQAVDIKAIFSGNGFELKMLRQDLGGRDRAMAFTLKSS